MFIEKSLFDARHREDKLLRCRLCGLCHEARQVDRRDRSVKVKMQGRLVSGLAVGKAGELFGVAEQEFDRETRFVETKDVCG